MVALTLADHLMMQQAQCELFPNTDALEDRPNPLGKTASRFHEGESTATFAKTESRSPVSQRVDEE